ncbi:MAG: ascorbate-dependent monooxygenase [Planctomycetes bacterium]|nr:ascorbate-dependent monooxygenase [Planctomycetota bacterium]
MNCHRPGEASPFPLTNYEEVSQRAGQINLVTKSRYMPPWKPVAKISHFQKELRLTDREIELIELWTKAGNPHGNPSELPPTPTFPAGWQLGKPDFVVRFPESVQLPAERNDVYQYFVIPSELVQDRLISAVEFRPGNRDVIEYMALTCDTTGKARELDAADPSPGYQRAGGPGFQPASLLGRWIPGARPHRYSQAIGRRIPAGADLVLGIHYRPSGKAEQDRSKVGVHFASGDHRIASAEILVADTNLRIPPGEGELRHVATYRLPMDVTLHSVSPHMRRLGRGIKVSALLPNGSNFPLIQIDDWDFHWQSRYLLRHPLRLPQGTRIEVEAVFDNSVENPYNPHLPPQRVQWGDRAVDEIALCFFDVTTDRPHDMQRLSQHNKQFLLKQSRRVQEQSKQKSGDLKTPDFLPNLREP